MPEFAERDEFERKLTREFADVGAQALDRLLRLIGDPPSLANVPPSYWIAIQRELARRYNPLLKEIYLLGAGDVIQEIGGPAITGGIIRIAAAGGIAIEWASINQAAVDWAKSYTYDLVKGIDSYSRRLLQKQVSRFFEESLSFDELRDVLAPTFGTTRGEAIGQTEVTRASVQGELGGLQEIEDAGIEMVTVFWTSNDAIVCPVCGPLHQKIVPVELAPPLHPRCRCHLNHYIADLVKHRNFERLEVTL